MRWHRFIPVVALVAAACGGSAAYDPNGSSNVAGAAGQASAEAGASSGAAAGSGGTAAGGAPVSGAGGAAGDGGDAGAGGQALPDCQGLDCLAGAELVYWPDREWQRALANPASNELLEADYEPKIASPWDVKFSSDALQIVLTPRAGGNAVQGVRDEQQTDRAWFGLMLPIGGRFVVQVAAPQFQAEYTAYGSGLPIVSSTRGALKEP